MDMILGIAGSAVVFFVVFALYVGGAMLTSRVMKLLFGKDKNNAASA